MEMKKFLLKKRLEALGVTKEYVQEYDTTDDPSWKESCVYYAKMWGRFSLEAKEKLNNLT